MSVFSKQAMNTAYIGLGSNLGDATLTIQQALARLDKLTETRLDAHSSLFRTAPIDAVGDDYINAVARIETRLDPEALLQELHTIEQSFGRKRPFRNAPRTLDLDILLYGGEQIRSDTLTVPHPRLIERAFALIPLLQIDPLVSIPGAGPAHAFAAGVSHQSIQRIDG